MKDEIIAKRYALALFRLARDSNKIEEALSSMNDVLSALEKRRDFFLWLDSLTVDNRRREDVARTVFSSAGILDIVMNTVLLLISRERIGIFEGICKQFRDLADDNKGLVRGSIFAANLGSASYIQESLSKTLSAPFKKTIVFENVEKKELIGGVMVKIKDTVWDASIRRRFKELKESLCQ